MLDKSKYTMKKIPNADVGVMLGSALAVGVTVVVIPVHTAVLQLHYC